MERLDLAAVLASCSGLAQPQRDRIAAFSREHPALDPRVLLHRLQAEGTLGADELNVALGAVLGRMAPEPHLAELSGRTVGAHCLAQRLGPLADGASYLTSTPGVVAKLLPVTLPEARLGDGAARLSKLVHPNLAALLDSGVAGGLPFLAVAHLPGRTLREAELPRAADGVAQGLRWAHDATRAVEALHRQGLVHGSLAPDDFIVGPDGAVCLGDLGVSLLDPEGPLRKAFGQGAAFAAPEVLLGQPVDARSDLYSLGTILYGLLARKPLFEALTPGALLQRRLSAKPSAEPLLRAGVPPAVAAVILKLLETRPDDRPAGLAPLAAALAGTTPPPAPAPLPPRPVARPATARRVRTAPAAARSSRLMPVAVSMAILAALAVVLVIVVLLRQDPPPAPPVAAAPPTPAPEPEPPTPVPSDRSPERVRLLAAARDAEKKGQTAEAIRLYREAAAIATDPLVAEKTQTLEAQLRDRSREEAEAEQLRKAAAALPPEAALGACEEFLTRWPKSRHAEEFLQLKRELVIRIREGAPPPPPPPPTDPPKEPSPPPPAVALRKREPGVPGRTLDPAIRAALLWLARHQNPDGSWDVAPPAGRCSPAKPCLPGPGHEDYAPGVSSLAVLSLLGAGIGWHDQDEYEGVNLGHALRCGVDALVAASRGGPVGGRARQKYLYNHALGVQALSEAVRSAHDIRTSEDPGLVALREAQAAAVEFLLMAQNPGSGWRYSTRCGDNDTSVTANAVTALESAKAAGSAIPAASFQNAVRWFESATEYPYGRVGYTHKGTGKVFVPGMNESFDHHETLTAAAWTCRQRLGSAPPNGVKNALEFVLRDLPSTQPNGVDYYYWYYGTRLLKEAGDSAQRTRWREALLGALRAQQPPDATGCARGSWEARDRWSKEAGRVYATALNALTLEHALLARPFEYPRRATALPPAAEADIRWIFRLKNGGQIRAVSYEEVQDKYHLKLPAGQTVILKESVEQIQKAPTKEKP